MADRTLENPARKPSVTRHPLFPAVVVVWFAALFGLASLAIHPSLIESLVVATGIDHIIAKAAPPLGTTARILIALMMTVLGGVIGLAVARRFAKPAPMSAARTRRASPADDTTSPVTSFGRADPIGASVDEEDEAEPIARRRRQLALPDKDDSFDDHMPLPSTSSASSQILDVAELPLKSFDEVDGIWLHDSDRATSTESHDAAAQGASGDTDEHMPILDDPAQASDFAASKPGNRLFDSYVRRLNAGVGSNDFDPTAPGFISLPKHAAQGGPEASPSGIDGAPADATTPVYSNTAERIASAPLDELSHVELLERLAQTIARRRMQQPTVVAPSVAAPEELPPEEILNVAVLPRVVAPQVVRPDGEVPAALRPHWATAHEDDDPDEDDDALPAFVPARSISLQAHAGRTDMDVASGKQSGDEASLEAGYSSLREMSKPALDLAIDAAREDELSEKPQPGRFAFPGRQGDMAMPASAVPSGPRVFDAPQALEPAADQTEQALRAALATLRRMSGTA